MGSPPSELPHAYLADGAHTIAVQLVDTTRTTTTRTLSVLTAHRGVIDLAASTPTAAGVVALTPTYTAGTGAVPVSYTYAFGDGTLQSGAGAPPAVSHAYAPGSYQPSLSVLDDHGSSVTSYDAVTTAPDAAAHPNVTVTADVPVALGAVVASSLQAPVTTVAAGEEVTIDTRTSVNVSLTSVDLGDGRGPDRTPSQTSFARYSAPGVKTITLVFTPAAGGAPVTVTRSLTVTPVALRAELVAPAVSPEGKVTVSTAGTVSPAGTFWVLSADDRPTAYGTGAVPPSLQTTAPAGSTGVQLSLQSPSGESAQATASTVTTSTRARVLGFGAGGTSGTAYVQAGADSLAFSAGLLPSTGHVITGGTLSFGDGAVVSAPVGLRSGRLTGPDSDHVYTTPGTYTAVLSFADSGGQRASQSLVVQVAGVPTLTPTVTPGARNASSTITLGGLSAGAGAALLSYTVDPGDDTLPTKTPGATGYGLPAAAVSHVYTESGTYQVRITLTNDREVTRTFTVPITIA